MTKDEFNLKYWMFYMQLENDFSKTFNYVEFTDDNLSTYSKEYAKQLISIGSELDIVFKALCNEVDPTKARSCITDYANILCGYDNLTDQQYSSVITKKVISHLMDGHLIVSHPGGGIIIK